MSQSAIRLLTLSVCATALVVASVVTPVSAKTSSHKHHAIHRSQIYRNHGFGYSRPANQTWPVTRPAIPSGQICPGIGRSFDYKIWPPPIDEDPDRKASGSDAG